MKGLGFKVQDFGFAYHESVEILGELSHGGLEFRDAFGEGVAFLLFGA